MNFAPTYSDIARYFHSNPDLKVKVGKVDTTEQRALGQRFSVSAYPSFFVVKGSSVYEFDGTTRSKDSLILFATKTYKERAVSGVDMMVVPAYHALQILIFFVPLEGNTILFLTDGACGPTSGLFDLGRCFSHGSLQLGSNRLRIVASADRFSLCRWCRVCKHLWHDLLSGGTDIQREKRLNYYCLVRGSSLNIAWPVPAPTSLRI
jgi:Thioredoxin